MIGRVLHAAAFYLCLLNTMDSQTTDKVEGVDEDFVRDGQAKKKPKKTQYLRAHRGEG
jgi:hypothetical protein